VAIILKLNYNKIVDNKESYNKIAKQWAEIRNNMDISSLVINFAQKVQKEGAILDIGCGTGLPLTKFLCDLNFSVTGLDFSEKMLEIAKCNSSIRANFILCDFMDYNTTQKFDGILAWDSLWHISKLRQKEIYSKVGQLLKPNGLFLFTHGNIDNEHIDTMMGEQFYYSALSELDIIDSLNENGMRLENSYKDFTENGTHRIFVVLARKI